MEVIKRNNISIKGEGKKVMLFAHGYGCDQNMWRFITPEFEKDYQVILFDHIGSGKSDLGYYNKNKYAKLHGYANDILDICDALNLKNVILVGHSVSTMIALLAANKNKSLFSHIIMICPSPCYINEENYIGGFSKEDILEMLESLESNYLGWSSSITPVIMGNPERPELTEELKNSFCRQDPEIAKHFARATFLGDYRKDLEECMTPTLIIQCSNDAIAPKEVGDYTNKHIHKSEMVTIEATGHCPHLSHPTETIQAIKNYLAVNLTDE
ncbi:MAG TPA: alpha/beta hydrolase [Leptospiraceae bacterium]|nr:alpha/beta hydrolase [Leptospiraceae bacterium]HMW07899.1 alpha/beta hydrolase [Leptospiraceae bacterium]HMX33762.1 alpha/beta hydrolase [Leptospiraceae bacterium]HMY31162.1 alpha/beta hydrolase [Leptospiraceae bacterium]HMZ65417.1 alpha/beta hydrolase [Leptospiraceae bacterium]